MGEGTGVGLLPISITVKELCEVLRRSAPSNMPAIELLNGIHFDSRSIAPGNIFVALPGAQTHGNSFAPQALANGAGLVIAEQDGPGLAGDHIIFVSDSLNAFHSLARYWREKLGLPTVAITGSSGKTTVKELLALVLQLRGSGNTTIKSYNNHVGVPFTLSQASPSDCWQIIEIGMNHRGEIAPLSELASPDVAIITNVGSAHIGNLGTEKEIAREKCDIVHGLEPEGVVILNADNDLLIHTYNQEYASNTRRVLTFGYNPSADCRVLSHAQTEQGLRVQLQCQEALIDVQTGLAGEHQARNIAAVVLTTRTVFPDISEAEIQMSLKGASAPTGRGESTTLNMPYGTLLLFDDSYNANPVSMSAFLQATAVIAAKMSNTICVLGDMAELGDQSELYHRQLARGLDNLPFAHYIFVGRFAEILKSEVSTKPNFIFSNVGDAVEQVLELQPDFVAVKGSRSVGLDQLCDAIKKRAN
jgi:UDP-N-acetylmuramoyl-tripeptide--D-alanyl-D-alanine ligase